MHRVLGGRNGRRAQSRAQLERKEISFDRAHYNENKCRHTDTRTRTHRYHKNAAGSLKGRRRVRRVHQERGADQGGLDVADHPAQVPEKLQLRSDGRGQARERSLPCPHRPPVIPIVAAAGVAAPAVAAALRVALRWL